jgi:hypothetical protein
MLRQAKRDRIEKRFIQFVLAVEVDARITVHLQIEKAHQFSFIGLVFWRGERKRLIDGRLN